MKLRCSKCKKDKLSGQFYAGSGNARGFHAWCKSCSSEYSKAKYILNADQNRKRSRLNQAEDRSAAIAVLGSRCVRCGFNDSRALQIYHINGGGWNEIRRIGGGGINRKVINGFTEEYQLLCANCNQIKKIENKETRRVY